MIRIACVLFLVIAAQIFLCNGFIVNKPCQSSTGGYVGNRNRPFDCNLMGTCPGPVEPIVFCNQERLKCCQLANEAYKECLKAPGAKNDKCYNQAIKSICACAPCPDLKG